jgi:hypothetical protein
VIVVLPEVILSSIFFRLVSCSLRRALNSAAVYLLRAPAFEVTSLLRSVKVTWRESALVGSVAIGRSGVVWGALGVVGWVGDPQGS